MYFASFALPDSEANRLKKQFEAQVMQRNRLFTKWAWLTPSAVLREKTISTITNGPGKSFGMHKMNFNAAPARMDACACYTMSNEHILALFTSASFATGGTALKGSSSLLWQLFCQKADYQGIRLQNSGRLLQNLLLSSGKLF